MSKINKTKMDRILGAQGAATSALSEAKFYYLANVTLNDKDIINISITADNTRPITPSSYPPPACVAAPAVTNNPTNTSEGLITEQLKAFRQAITDLKGANLYTTAHLTLSNENNLNIRITATNATLNNPNLNAISPYPAAGVFPAAPHV